MTKFKCLDPYCELEFEVASVKQSPNVAVHFCCPKCQSKVRTI